MACFLAASPPIFFHKFCILEIIMHYSRDYIHKIFRAFLLSIHFIINCVKMNLDQTLQSGLYPQESPKEQKQWV